MFARLFAIGLCLATAAGAPAADVTLKSVRFGDAILGSKPSADALKGKVVLVELWGIN
jgi:hypothetical protein